MHDSEIPELGSLRRDDVLHLIDGVVNSLTVLDVNERTEVQDASCHQGKAPERNNLNEEE